MKFALFFTLLLICVVYQVITLDNNFRFFYLWPTLNMLLMSIAYAVNKPGLILGKSKEGSINSLLLILNLPWLLLTWIIFKIQILLIREDFCNQLKGTNLWMSRRPVSVEEIKQFEFIIDLTAEFSRDNSSVEYICYPNLDAHALYTLPDSKEIPLDKKVLIHCANGHGRTAQCVAIILKQRKIVESLREGLKMVKESRGLASPNSAQEKWLLKQDL
jgi:hypothetical protein